MTKKEAIHFLYQIADEIRSFLDKTSSPKGQWTSHKRLEALSMAISALYDLFQAEEDGRLIIPPCKVGDTVWVITGTAIKLCTVDRIHILGNGQVQIRAKYFVTDNIYLYPDMFGKEEAIQQLDGAEMMVLNREITQFNQAIIMAISALRTQQKQANECTKCQSDKIRHKQESVHNDPLVLDELRQMRGEPVWCKELECYGIVKMEKVGRWANELFLVGTWHNGDVAVNFEYDIKSRGLTLYRHKPEEVQDEL